MDNCTGFVGICERGLTTPITGLCFCEKNGINSELVFILQYKGIPSEGKKRNNQPTMDKFGIKKELVFAVFKGCIEKKRKCL